MIPARARPQAVMWRRVQDPAWWCAVALLVITVAAAYRDTLDVPFLLDDADSIANNASIHSLATAWRPPADSGITVSGRPLLNVSLAINHAIHGATPAGYHVGNILIHLAATLCLFGLAWRTLRLPALAERHGAHAVPLAALGAALWALHPMQTAAVTYIIQRAELLAGVCLLFTLYGFLRAEQAGSRGWAVASVAVCWLGMAAKEVMAAAPLVVLVYDRVFLSGSWSAAWRRHRGVYVALAAGWLVLAALIVSSGARGDTVGFGAVPWTGYVLTQLAGIARYLACVVYPPALVFDHGAVVEDRVWPILLGALVVSSLFVATVVLLRRARPAGFSGAWFLLILAPTSSVVPVATQTIADHRMYLPLAAVVFSLVLLAYRLRPRIAWTVLPVLVVACLAGTISRNRTFGSAISIWEDTVAKAPHNARAWSSLGVAYLEAGRTDDALRMLEQAAVLSPDSAAVQADLALACVRTDRPYAALNHYERALQLAPDFVEARLAYGGLLRGLGHFEASREQLQAAVERAPDSARAREGLGMSLLALERPGEAILELEAAVRLDPARARTRYFLGEALASVGRFDEAIGHLESVAADAPQPLLDLINQIGVLHAHAGRPAEAVTQFRRVLEIDPDHTQARDNLAAIEAQSGAEAR